MARIKGNKVTFKKYLEMGLKRGAWGLSLETEFAGDALRDPSFPDFEEWEIDELAAYIRGTGGDTADSVMAAKKLFRKWRAA